MILELQRKNVHLPHWCLLCILIPINDCILSSIGPVLFNFGHYWVDNIVTVVAHVAIIIWLIDLVAIGAWCMTPVWSIWEGIFQSLHT